MMKYCKKWKADNHLRSYSIFSQLLRKSGDKLEKTFYRHYTRLQTDKKTLADPDSQIGGQLSLPFPSPTLPFLCPLPLPPPSH